MVLFFGKLWNLGRTKTPRSNSLVMSQSQFFGYVSSEGKQYRIMEKPRALNMIVYKMQTTVPNP